MELPPAEFVAAAQRLAVESRALRGERTQWHAGDLAWNFGQDERRADEWDIRTWVADGRLVAGRG